MSEQNNIVWLAKWSHFALRSMHLRVDTFIIIKASVATSFFPWRTLSYQNRSLMRIKAPLICVDVSSLNRNRLSVFCCSRLIAHEFFKAVPLRMHFGRWRLIFEGLIWAYFSCILKWLKDFLAPIRSKPLFTLRKRFVFSFKNQQTTPVYASQ